MNSSIASSFAARHGRSWVPTLARFGFAAHGVLYLTVGALAVMVATGATGNARMDSKGAPHQIHEQPFGQVLLVLLALGLAGYSVWRFVQAALDPENEAHGREGMAKRVSWALGGVLHAALVVYAIGLITGSAMGQGGRGAKGWAATVMSWDPVGPWLVGAAGAAFIISAYVQFRRAMDSKLDRQLDLGRMKEKTRRVLVQVSRFGIAARGVVFALVGLGLVVAAATYNPAHAKDVSEALDTIRGWSFGPLLLGIVALGLAAFGIYELIEARYRKIRAV